MHDVLYKHFYNICIPSDGIIIILACDVVEDENDDDDDEFRVESKYTETRI